MARLYSDVILDRFRHPRYFGELDAPDAAYEDVNPLCGDRVRIEVRLDGGHAPEIGAVRYRGDACAIALASADLLAEMVEGRPLGEAARVGQDRLLAALQADIRPSRLRCVTLPLDVFHAALAGCEAGRTALGSPAAYASRNPGGGGLGGGGGTPPPAQKP